MLGLTDWVLVGSGFITGLVSAVTALMPIEAVVLTAAATRPDSTAAVVALAAAAGQTVGKVLIVTAVRGAGSQRWLPRRLRDRAAREAAAVGDIERGAPTDAQKVAAQSDLRTDVELDHRLLRRCSSRLRGMLRRLTECGVRWLDGRWAPAVVVLSGAVGLPPLLLMSVAAGLAGMRLSWFAVACFAGRSVRFLALIWIPGLPSLHL